MKSSAAGSDTFMYAGSSGDLIVPDTDRAGARIERRWSVVYTEGGFVDLLTGSAAIVRFREARL